MITHQLSATTPDDPTYEIRPSHWNQEHAQAFTILGNTSGQSTISGTNIVLSAGPNATISVNGSTLVFSGGAGAAGNTGYLSDDAGVTASLGTIRFSNSNGIGWGINGQTLTASHNGLTSQSNQAVSAANGSYAFQTLSFSNANGFSFGTSAGSAITGSYTVPTQTNQTVGIYATSNTTGQSSSSTYDARSLTIRGYGVLSVGNSNGSILLSTPDAVEATLLSVGNSNLGNTAGDTGVFTGRVVFVGSNNITLSGSSNGGSQTISIIGGAGGGFSAGVSGGNTSGDTGATGTRVVFAGGNNITLSQSTNANGATITVSGANAGGVQTGISGIIVSDATYTSGTVSFSNQNGVTIGSSVNGASQYIRLSVNTSYLASNASSNYVHVSGSATTVSGVTTANVIGTNSTRWAMEDHQHAGVYGAGVSNVGNTAGNTAAERPGRWMFAGSNAITLSQETAANSAQTIHIQGPVSATTISGVTSANVIGTRGSRFALEDHQHVGVYSAGVSTGGNTAGDTAVRPGQIVFAGGANITLSMATAAGSLQTVSIVGGGGGGGFTGGMSNIGNTAGTSGTVQSQMLVVGGPNITVSQSINGNSATLSISGNAPGAAAENNWLNLLGANTAGNTTASGSTIGLSGINLTLSGTNNSVVNISAPATSSLVGVSGISISTNGSTISVMQNVLTGYDPQGPGVELVPGQQGNGTFFVQQMGDAPNFAFNALVLPLHFTATSNSSGSVTLSMWAGIYTRNVSTLSMLHSTSYTTNASMSGTVGSYSLWSGFRNATVPWTSTVSAGDYWVGIGSRTTTGGAAGMTISQLLASQPGSNWNGPFGQANNATHQYLLGQGFYTATTAGVPASIGFSQISGTGSLNLRQPRFHFASTI